MIVDSDISAAQFHKRLNLSPDYENDDDNYDDKNFTEAWRGDYYLSTPGSHHSCSTSFVLPLFQNIVIRYRAPDEMTIGVMKARANKHQEEI